MLTMRDLSCAISIIKILRTMIDNDGSSLAKRIDASVSASVRAWSGLITRGYTRIAAVLSIFLHGMCVLIGCKGHVAWHLALLRILKPGSAFRSTTSEWRFFVYINHQRTTVDSRSVQTHDLMLSVL